MQLVNNTKTVLLLGGLTGLFMLIGNALGGSGGMMVAFFLAALMNLGAWWFSDKLALKFSGAQEVSPQDAPDLHRMVEQLAVRANLPKPRVYMINSPVPNAFATGRDPQNGAVAVTTGIMQALTREELAGVVAHELAHIKNRDTLISSVAATIGGAVTMVAEMAMWAAMFGGFGGSDDEEGGNPIGGLFMLFLAPIAAMIIQMAISRSREYVADATGAQILGNPHPLADALEKLEHYGRNMHQMRVNPATSHQYIINPLHGGGVLSLFSTHPATQDRVAKLRAMTVASSVAVA
jgi:heat shock protein HtpX